ncbi:MAG: MarR family winged helix-turn-helix transcriptional regulator [Oscillospiraceae bacterium]
MINISDYLNYQICVGELYSKLLDAAAEEHKLTKPEAAILIFLKNNPDFDTARDIAKYRGLSKAYVSKAVDHLLQKSLITVVTDKVDRRLQRLKLTAKAQLPADRLRQVQIHFVDMITRGISEQEKSIFVSSMEKISSNAEQILCGLVKIDKSDDETC